MACEGEYQAMQDAAALKDQRAAALVTADAALEAAERARASALADFEAAVAAWTQAVADYGNCLQDAEPFPVKIIFRWYKPKH